MLQQKVVEIREFIENQKEEQEQTKKLMLEEILMRECKLQGKFKEQ